MEKIIKPRRYFLLSEFKNVEEKKYFAGRKAENDLFLNDGDISRIHFVFYFKNELWTLVDGDETKKSNNGTWLYPQEPVKIENGMSFKYKLSTFVVEYVN